MNRALVRKRAARHARRQKKRSAQKRRAVAVLEGWRVLAKPWKLAPGCTSRLERERRKRVAGELLGQRQPNFVSFSSKLRIDLTDKEKRILRSFIANTPRQ